MRLAGLPLVAALLVAGIVPALPGVPIPEALRDRVETFVMSELGEGGEHRAGRMAVDAVGNVYLGASNRVEGAEVAAWSAAGTPLWLRAVPGSAVGAVVLHPDGWVLAFGTSTDARLQVTRLAPLAGVVVETTVVDLGATVELVHGAVRDLDGTIQVLAWGSSPRAHLLLARLTFDGALLSVTDLAAATFRSGAHLAVLASGDLAVVSVTARLWEPTILTVLRVTPDGEVVATAQLIHPDPVRWLFSPSVAAAPDGGLAVVGVAANGRNGGFVARFGPDLTLQSFRDGYGDRLGGAAFDAEGGLVAAGLIRSTGPLRTIVVRFEPDGSPQFVRVFWQGWTGAYDVALFGPGGATILTTGIKTGQNDFGSALVHTRGFGDEVFPR